MCSDYYVFYLKPKTSPKNVLPTHVVTDSYDYENAEFLQNSKRDDDGNVAYYLMIILLLLGDDTLMLTFTFIFLTDEPDYINAND